MALSRKIRRNWSPQRRRAVAPPLQNGRGYKIALNAHSPEQVNTACAYKFTSSECWLGVYLNGDGALGTVILSAALVLPLKLPLQFVSNSLSRREALGSAKGKLRNMPRGVCCCLGYQLFQGQLPDPIVAQFHDENWKWVAVASGNLFAAWRALQLPHPLCPLAWHNPLLSRTHPFFLGGCTIRICHCDLVVTLRCNLQKTFV